MRLTTTAAMPASTALASGDDSMSVSGFDRRTGVLVVDDELAKLGIAVALETRNIDGALL
jgi:hypothetical protein